VLAARNPCADVMDQEPTREQFDGHTVKGARSAFFAPNAVGIEQCFMQIALLWGQNGCSHGVMLQTG
jgi:hypothetical protein